MRNDNPANMMLERNWLQIDGNITEILFQNYTKLTIKSTAFQSAALMNLEELTFSYCNLLNLEPGSFNGLIQLRIFTIFFSNIFGVNQTTFRLFGKSLRLFVYTNFPNDILFDHFFGVTKMSRLTHITVTMVGPKIAPRFLHASNFSGLSVVESIKLENCGIEYIDDGTFDYVSATLRHLDLQRNHIKNLRFKLFEIFFDKWQKSSKFLLLLFSNIECNCHFYETKNISLISFGFFEPPYIHDRMKCNASQTIIQSTSCQNSHAYGIQTKKMCISIPLYTHLWYPKFNLRVVDNILNISTTINSKYRLIILNHWRMWKPKKKIFKCPDKYWLNESISCYTFPNQSQAISIQHFLSKSRLVTFGVVFLSTNKKIWPLNIASVYNAYGHDKHTQMIFSYYMIMMLSASAGFVLGTILAKYVLNHKTKCSYILMQIIVLSRFFRHIKSINPVTEDKAAKVRKHSRSSSTIGYV